jgi:hypothetical protein
MQQGRGHPRLPDSVPNFGCPYFSFRVFPFALLKLVFQKGFPLRKWRGTLLTGEIKRTFQPQSSP